MTLNALATALEGRGDQLVRLMVDIPSGDTALEKALEGWTDTRPVRADLGV
jgi:hypothetical protein